MLTFFRPVLTGLGTIICLLLVISVILSLLLHYTSLQESSLSWLLLPATLLTLFIGGCVSGFLSGTRGWYFGGCTGISFILFTWLISFLGFESSLRWEALWLYLTFLGLAMIGGVIGVNLSPPKRREPI